MREERLVHGKVKTRQRLAEEKSIARSTTSAISTFGRSSAAFASTSARDKSSAEAMKYVNPELRAKQRQHERMLVRSRRRAERLNEAVTIIQATVRRRLGQASRLSRLRWRGIQAVAPIVQAAARGWKVRARLRWCTSIALLIERSVRGWLSRRRTRLFRGRVPFVHACARGFLARADFRRCLHAACTIQAHARGAAARSRARAFCSDPQRVRTWAQLQRLRELVSSLDMRLGSLASGREAERSQLKLAMKHEIDKVSGGDAHDVPAVTVMRKQDELAEADSVEIAAARERTGALIGMLAQMPFARAADAIRAVREEVEWLSQLVEHQTLRDDLYRPASQRHTNLPPSKLTILGQLDSYRSNADDNTRPGFTPRGCADDDGLRSEGRAPAAVPGVVLQGGLFDRAPSRPPVRPGAPGKPSGARTYQSWGAACAPASMDTATLKAALVAPAGTPPQSSRSSSNAAQPLVPPAAKRSWKEPPPPPGTAPWRGRGPPPPGRNKRRSMALAPPNPRARRPSSNTPAGHASSLPAARAGSPLPSGHSDSRGASGSVGFSNMARSVGRRPSMGPSQPRTQLRFEEERLAMQLRAQAAREAQELERAKRQAQRSKRVANLAINPDKLEEQKLRREREARAAIRAAKQAERAAREAEEAEKAAEAEAVRVKADAMREHALERLRTRKIDERAKEEKRQQSMALLVAAAAKEDDESRRARAEMRRLRAETPFFDRQDDVVPRPA